MEIYVIFPCFLINGPDFEINHNRVSSGYIVFSKQDPSSKIIFIVIDIIFLFRRFSKYIFNVCKFT